MVAVRYQNTGKIKDIDSRGPFDALENTWGFTFLIEKDWNTDPYEQHAEAMGIANNFFLYSAVVLNIVTSAVTSKSMMPAVLIVINQQKLYLTSVIETEEPYFRRFLYSMKLTFFEN